MTVDWRIRTVMMMSGWPNVGLPLLKIRRGSRPEDVRDEEEGWTPVVRRKRK